MSLTGTSASIPVLKVDLERTATLKKLLTSIRDQFGDPHSTPGNELFLKRRVMADVERFVTELLFVDEVQHLNYRSGPKNDVEDTLEGMLDAGVVPTVFLGTQDAGALVGRNLQLNGRLLPPCDFEPLRARVKEDQRLFAGFAAKLEKAIVEQGVLGEASGLDAAGMLPAIFRVSKGVAGRS